MILKIFSLLLLLHLVYYYYKIAVDYVSCIYGLWSKVTSKFALNFSIRGHERIRKISYAKS